MVIEYDGGKNCTKDILEANCKEVHLFQFWMKFKSMNTND